MDRTLLSVLIANASLLLVSGLFYDLIIADSKINHNIKRVFYGLVIGFITLGLMSTPWRYSSGIIFDTRSIILSISGLYFGFIPTMIASIMAVTYRIIQGGAGAPTGVSVIIAASAIGYLTGLIVRKDHNKTITVLNIAVMSYMTHIVMLILMMLLPAEDRWIIIKTITLPVLTIYPVATILLGNLLNNQKRRNIRDSLILEKEEQFRSLYEQAPIPYQSLSPDLRFLTVNDTWLQVMGYRKEEIVNKMFPDFLHPDDTATQKRYFEKFCSDGFINDAIMRIRKSDGTYNTVAFTGRIVHDPDGQFIRTHCIFKDITSETQTRSALLASQQSLQNLFDQAPIGIFKTTSKGKALTVNPELAKLVGFNSPQEVLDYYKEIGHDLYVNPERRIEFLNLLKRDGKVEHFEYEANTKSGGHIWLSMNAKVSEYISDDEFIIEGFTTDVTEKTLALTALKDSEAHLRSIFSVAPVGIGVEKNRVIISVNSAMTNILGYAKDELIGQNSRFLYPNDEEYDFVGAEKVKLIERHGTAAIETKMLHKDGRIVNVILSSTPLNTEDFSRGFTFVIQDITSRKLIENRIRDINQELEQRVQMRTEELLLANKELQSFAYSVAHDLRTPLRAISGFTQFLLEDYSATIDDEGKRLLSVIISNTNHMDKLITDILTLTKVARETLKKRIVNQEKIISSVLNNSFQKPVLARYNIVVNRLPEVYCDSDLIKQVWINLISNAIKYTSPKTDKRIEIGCYKEENRYVFFIKDNGVGFDPLYTEKLFEAFQRLHKNTEFEGTGVGLAIVHSIISKHNGEVWAKGIVNEGAEFYFTLPILED